MYCQQTTVLRQQTINRKILWFISDKTSKLFSSVYLQMQLVYTQSCSVDKKSETYGFTDIYCINHEMIFSIKNQKLKLYLSIGLLFFVLLELIVFASDREHFWQRTLNHIWLIPYLALSHYCLFEFTIPFLRRKWIHLLSLPLFVILHIFLYTIGSYAWRQLGILLHVYFELKVFKNIELALEYFTGFSVGSLFFFGIARHLYYYIKLKQSAQQLTIEKQQAELNYLKSQTNPHFLFNTLNNIYSLSRDKSDLAPESILRLSKILRYMLYETNGSNIAVEQELKILTDYIELEKLRYDDSLKVNFNYNVEDMKQSLPPLLLVPLVENAFKHGVSETRNRPFVDIHLSVLKQQLKFVVRNSIEPAAEEQAGKENIGLSNLRRQLELLYKEHSLTIVKEANLFSANLQINLLSYVAN
jgi:two-component system, LytTR family, sensor kinase